jgi:tRNA(Ile)-lysidine synthase
VVVDHGLQPGSAGVAARAAELLRALGLEPVEVVTVEVTSSGDGLEAAARDARYAALDAAADRHGALAVLLGHTLDDQAEQVLLGLARGAGARSLSGMPSARGRFRRPLLAVSRAQCRDSARARGLAWWDDPMNDDPAFTRVRARRALADLERDLGPGVTAALARTASLLRDDADHLDAAADASAVELGPQPWAAEALTGIPRALRTRVWRRLLVAAGAPAGQVTTRHTDACDRLLTAWHGQGPVHAPGDLRVARSGGRVTITPPDRVD